MLLKCGTYWCLYSCILVLILQKKKKCNSQKNKQTTVCCIWKYKQARIHVLSREAWQTQAMTLITISTTHWSHGLSCLLSLFSAQLCCSEQTGIRLQGLLLTTATRIYVSVTGRYGVLELKQCVCSFRWWCAGTTKYLWHDVFAFVSD